MKVYLAASSGDLDRARWAMNALTELGHTVTHDWVSLVEQEQAGEANPLDASPLQRECWASEDLGGVDDCEVFWLLMPTDGSFGAGWEAGYAYAEGKRVVISGLFGRSIFTSLVQCYEWDADALREEFPGVRVY